MLAAVTALYASLTALLLIAISFRIVQIRRTGGIGLGDGGNDNLLHAMRLQSNLAEYAPVSLILLLLLELNLLDRTWLHIFGLIFLGARILHVWGFGSKSGYSFGRFFGTLVTWLNIIAMSVVNVFLILSPS